MGAKQWEEATCIDFKEDKDKKAENSIILIKEDGCWSYVGRVGGEQPLSLGDGCEQVGIATHELGHALGLFHTMSRYDRDDFITVVLENVVEGFVDQYIKETPQTTTNYGFTYDYGSIMHYGASSASHNNKPTMVANDTRYQESMGSQILSFIDKSMINDHYNCKGKQIKTPSEREKLKGGTVQQNVPKQPQPNAKMVDSLIHENAQNVFAQVVMAVLFVINE
ncbi:astacin [Teladorsagia circumcincta]|uniref:Metalloendopeptidase n=1 Tax=Teladorsagia circumcincta TaxID=45464 RepID=A0A2G9T6E9_TELCI|nr:astacin [Teladorsagia circumcincta]